MARAEQQIEPSLSAPAEARRFVDATLDDWDCDADVRTNAEVLTSEVVSDAVRQKPSQVAVLVEHADGVVRVEVSDDPGLILNTSETANFERGAGRRLLHALSRRWGSDADRHRTTTWFELGRLKR
jgi:hypothetical protein